MIYQITLDADSPTRNSLTYYGAWPMMIVWGVDRFIRFVSLVTVNFGYLNPWSSQNSKKELDAVVEVLSPDYVRVSLHRSKHFHWRPGQNVYLSFPSISTFPFESHPFTISTIDDNSKSDDSTLVFIIRAQRGFTKRLLKDSEASSDTTYTVGHTYKVFLNGPYGSPPLLIDYQTVILIAGLFFLSLHLALLIIYVL
jgi:ferric-chelate reductase